MSNQNEQKQPALKVMLEKVIFNAKWLLILFYIPLIFTMGLYLYIYIEQLVHAIHEVGLLNKETGMLFLLEMVDMVMIANLVKMIITGSYNSFVSKTHGYSNENISSGMLKVKMSTSLVGVSSIYLLQKFIDIDKMNWETLWKLLAIHGVFLLGAWILSRIEYEHKKSELLEEQIKGQEYINHLHELDIKAKTGKHEH